MSGISPNTIAYLADLRANNNRSWFDAHRDAYEVNYVCAGRELVTAIGERLRSIAPGIEAQPKILGSILRVNRDMRYSNDESPYKDHLDLWFWEGERRTTASGFFVRITPDCVGVGAGSHGFDKRELESFRTALATPAGAALVGIVDRIQRRGRAVRGEHYKRFPPGVDPNCPAAALARHKALYVHHDLPLTPTVHTPEVFDEFMAVWSDVAPLHRWLERHLRPSRVA